MYSVLLAAAEPDLRTRIGKYVPNINQEIEIEAAEDEGSAISRIREGGVSVVVYEQNDTRDAFAFFDQMLRGPGENLPFILLSPHKDADLAIRAMDVRMDYYVPEDTPNFFSELASRIMLSAERRRSAE
jgi:DNA-binding NarL/FixJ family response regulator